MIDLEIRHVTTYRYRRPVELWPHRLLLRPRESRELRLTSWNLETTPPASLTWAHDVFGNAVATATFAEPSNILVIDSLARVGLDVAAWPVFPIAASAVRFPFRYDDGEWVDLGSLSMPQHADPGERLRTWVQAFVRGASTDTLALLKDIGAGVSAWISYQSRDVEGTQTPIETLDRGWGSCRDFAVLFAEAVRTLGFGARIVSGYLHDPSRSAVGSFGGGSTHAWAEVYVPGAGWITFDPTNRSIGGANLIPVAVVRDIRQAVPVAGSFHGVPDDLLGMSVGVSVTG
ncbi:MAG: transglutaminase family protein [Siculibacillus sp.]|nr:transglutaminase family protein [Siculibacillus sp.]